MLGSYLADRIGFRGVLVGSLTVAGIALFGYFVIPGLGGYVALILSGLAFGPSHTLYLVSGQRRFPGRMATVAGFMLGFTFVSGSGGAWIMGLVGDGLGLRAALGALPVMLIASAVCAACSVPSRRQMPAVEAATAESP